MRRRCPEVFLTSLTKSGNRVARRRSCAHCTVARAGNMEHTQDPEVAQENGADLVTVRHTNWRNTWVFLSWHFFRKRIHVSHQLPPKRTLPAARLPHGSHFTTAFLLVRGTSTEEEEDQLAVLLPVAPRMVTRNRTITSRPKKRYKASQTGPSSAPAMR